MPRRAKKKRRRQSQGVSREPRRWPWVFAVFAAALVVRTLFVLDLEGSPAARLRLGDALSYHTWAQNIAGGEWIGSEVFYQAPLYPYFVAVQYAAVGESLLALRMTQAILGALACWLLALAGSRFFGWRVGLVAGFLLALYAPAIFFTGLIQKTVLGLFLSCLLLWLVSRVDAPTRPALALAIGAVLGALALTRENAILLAVPVFAWVVLRARSRVAVAGFLVGGMGLALGPVLVRNHHVSGEWHLTTSQLGPNLYIGNNPEATGTYRPLRPGRQDALFERHDATEIAEEALGRELTAAEVSSFYVSRTLDYVRSEPLDWTKLMGRKLALVWNGTEVGDTEDLYAYATMSPVLRLSMPVHFGLLVALALAGAVVTWRDWNELWILHAVLAVYSLSVVAFYVFARYRFPLVPVVTLFAAAALVHARAWFRDRAPRQWVPAAVAVGLAAVFCSWPLVDRDDMQSTTHYNFGYGLANAGDARAAMEQFRAALRLDPGFAKARNDLGIMLGREGKLDAAALEFERTIQGEPDFDEAWANLGEVRLQQGRLDDAKAHFERALELNAKSVGAVGGLASFYFHSRDLDRAETFYERSLHLQPDNAGAHNNLGVIAAMRGDIEEAIVHFEEALRIDPLYGEAKKNLERALAAS